MIHVSTCWGSGASESDSGGYFSSVTVVDLCSFYLVKFYFGTDFFQFQINIYVWFGKTYPWADWVGQLLIAAIDRCC